MDKYAIRHGLDDDNAIAFVEILTAMDAVYLVWQGEELEAKRKAAKKQ